MIEFTGQSLVQFVDKFKTDLDCKSYLADIKWNTAYKCKKCGHSKFTLRKCHTHTCTRCKHNESPTAGTAFHKVKFGLRKAFMITYEMTNSTKGMSAKQIGKRYGITRKTAWLFMHKIRKIMKSSQTMPMEGTTQVDEFTVGGKEEGKQGRSYDTKKKKIVGAVELTETGKIKRMYAIKIDDYSSKSLRRIFEKHMSPQTNVKTDKWRGYIPLKSEYNIEQTLSNNGQGLMQLHTMIHQLKSWLRTIYSWVHIEHIDSYLNEFVYRINRSKYKNTIFHKIIERVIEAPHLGYKQIVIVAK